MCYACLMNQKTLILMRGLPGSGKSTFAKALTGIHEAVYVSADEMLESSNGYFWSYPLSCHAHEICRSLVELAMQQQRKVIVLDNMHLRPFRAKPYVDTARKHGYNIEIMEPSTPWKADIEGLLQNGTHKVRREQMETYLEIYTRIPLEIFKDVLDI